MGRSKETFGKKEVRIKKEKKRKEKEQKRLERKESKGSSFDDMIAYVDEFGNITSTPPDLSKRKEIDIESIEVSVRRSADMETEETVRKGIVSFFNHSKGFGFIKDSLTKEDVFVHINGLTEPIQENNVVTFEVERGPKGFNAVNVKIFRE